MAQLSFNLSTQKAPLYHHEDLGTFLERRSSQPEILDATTLSGLSAHHRAAYDSRRISYLSGDILVNTPQLQQVNRSFEKLLLLNSARSNIGNNGLMVTGAGNAGKTTASIALMRWVYAHYARQVPHMKELGHIPVAYVEVPAGSNAKRLVSAFARFFGLTVAPRDTQDHIQEQVIGAMNRANTQLVVIDELHNLTAHNRGIIESVDQLKILSNRVSSTFVYSGVGLNDEMLITQARGRQVAGRFTMIELAPFNLSDPEHRAAWAGIINDFERQLPLADQVRGTLVKQASLLYERSGGSLGSLKNLITGAAIDAILNEGLNEQVTADLINAQAVDMAAASTFAKSLTAPRRGKAA
jgi:hypothetical protein